MTLAWFQSDPCSFVVEIESGSHRIRKHWPMCEYHLINHSAPSLFFIHQTLLTMCRAKGLV